MFSTTFCVWVALANYRPLKVNVIPVKQLVIFMVFWEVLVYESQKYFANVGLHVGANQSAFSSLRWWRCEFKIFIAVLCALS